MPAGNTSLQGYVPSVFTTQSATAYKTNLDSNSSIVGNPAAAFYVYPTSPASMLVNVDIGFSYMKVGTGWVLNNGGPTVQVTLVAPGSNSYYATIYFDSIVNGCAVVYSPTSVSPTPILPESICQIPLAVVILTSTTTTVQATNITDVRGTEFLPLGKVGTLSANTSYNVMGANQVTLSFSYTAAITVTFTSLQMGVPVFITANNGTGGSLVLKVAASSPNGAPYSVFCEFGGAIFNLTTSGTLITATTARDIVLCNNPDVSATYTLRGPLI